MPFNRRLALTGLGALLIGSPMGRALAQPDRLTLVARPGLLALRPGEAPIPIGELVAPGTPPLRLKQGTRTEIALRNELASPVALSWRGFAGEAVDEPLLGRGATAPDGIESYRLSTPHAGTLVGDLWLLADGMGGPVRPLAAIVEESQAVAVDRDELFLVEDWRLGPDGRPLVAGRDNAGATPIFTVNGSSDPEFKVRRNERLRLRFVNGCQRAVIAVKIEGHELTIMALDGQPAEPFLARNGALVLPPGGRCDAFLDAATPPGAVAAVLLHDGKESRRIARLIGSTEPPTRPTSLGPPAPLPGNGLPQSLSLRSALRVDVPLGGSGDGMRPANFSSSAPPAFRAKAGRTVVLAVANRGATGIVFHLHGHHFRLLDRLDDGWKPYWLDTLAIEAGQTQRIAFMAEHRGRWLIETTAVDWAAPRLVRWYAVE